MRLFTKLLSLALILITLGTNANNREELILKARTFTPEAINTSAKLNKAVAELAVDGYFIVQFKEIPTQTEKKRISANGISLLDYLPEFAFLAYANNPSEIQVGGLNIRAIVPFEADFKFHPELKQRIFPPHVLKESNQVELMVEKQRNVNINQVKIDLASVQAEIKEISTNEAYLVIWVDKDNIDALGNLASVKFIDFGETPPEPDDTRARSLHRGNMLDSDHPLGKKYDGSGVAVAIADDGDIGPHIDIKGRVTSFAPASRGTHGDMTTGITMGAGNLNPNYRGMATDAYLYYYDIGGYPHIAQGAANFANRGIVVTSTSYSEGCNAGYTSTTQFIDQQVRQNPSILHVFSAGNSAGSTCGSNAYGAGTPWGTITGGRKQGKNVIATGNLEYQDNLTASSSRGPAKDGRIKPDICANGTNQISTDPNNGYRPGGGTSAAAPGIAGIAVQMYDGYRQINGGANPEAALIKGSMLNTAEDLGNPGPDYFYGWGRINAHRAFKLIEENRYVSNNISQGQTQTQTINVSSPLAELRVMVYWTDYEAATNAAKDLVNDLDIKLYLPNGDSLQPWVLNRTPNASLLSANAVRGSDSRNNMEQVSLTSVATGNYTVKINGTAVPQGPQKYYLMWETVEDDIEVTYPSGGEPFVPGNLETIRWDAFGNSGSFNIAYSLDSGLNWTTLTSNLAGSRRYYNFTVPNSITGDALVRVSRGGITGISANPFTIAPTPNLTAQFTCPDSIRLTWTAIPTITEYEVSELGATHMDSIGRTTGTSFMLYNRNLSDDNWVSVKAINPSAGIVGQRAVAIQLPKVPLNCPLDYDMGVTQINLPGGSTISNCNLDKLPVQITINNNGDSVLNNVPLRMVANGVTYNDTVVGPLPSKSFQFFTFRDSITLTPGNLTITVFSDLIGDQNDLNDSVSSSINVIGGQVFIIPYSNDFENFSICSNATNCGTTVCNLNGGWVNVSSPDDVFDMRVWSGPTASAGTGPSTDHNPGTSTGKYIYSESSGGCNGVESHVISPCFDLTGTINPELSFWYHMDGQTMGVLRIDIQSNGVWNTNVITPLFGDKGDIWLEQLVDLSSYAGEKINVRFRITSGSSFTSDLAIDDVSITDISTGLTESAGADFSLYPNPTEGNVKLRFSKADSRIIQVLDMQGRQVYQVQSSNRMVDLDLSGLEKGVYFIQLPQSGKTEKVVLY